MAENGKPEVSGQSPNDSDKASDEGSDWQDVNDSYDTPSIDFVTLGMFIIGKFYHNMVSSSGKTTNQTGR